MKTPNFSSAAISYPPYGSRQPEAGLLGSVLFQMHVLTHCCSLLPGAREQMLPSPEKTSSSVLILKPKESIGHHFRTNEAMVARNQAVL